MAISAVATSTLQFRGDGSATSLVVDLANAVFTDGANHPENILRADNLPTGTASVLVDGSSSGFTTALSGTLLTLTFTTAPNASTIHSLLINALFAGF
jgi:hypothetical protein